MKIKQITSIAIGKVGIMATKQQQQKKKKQEVGGEEEIKTKTTTRKWLSQGREQFSTAKSSAATSRIRSFDAEVVVWIR